MSPRHLVFAARLIVGRLGLGHVAAHNLSDHCAPAQASRSRPAYGVGVNKSTLWTVLGVVVAVVIAWVLVDVLLSLAWFLVKVALVAVVAIVVFFVLRSVLSRSSD